MNKAIPDFSSGDPAQSSDLLVTSRSSSNFKLTAGSVASQAGLVKTFQRTISSSEILNLATAPVELLPPVAGQGIYVIDASLVYTPGTTPYADSFEAANNASITSVDAPTLTTDTLTECQPMGDLQPLWSGIAKYSGSISGPATGSGCRVNISGFATPGNNITNGVVIGGNGSYILVQNPDAVAETHSGSLVSGTVVMHGTNMFNFFQTTSYSVQGLNPANNGSLFLLSSTSTTATVSNPNGVAEGSTSGTIYNQFGQVLVMFIPGTGVTQPFLWSFGTPAPVEPGLAGGRIDAMSLVGDLNPRVGTTSPFNTQGIAAINKGLYFSIADPTFIQRLSPWLVNLPFDEPASFASGGTPLPVAAVNLTGGDGTLQLTVSYFLTPTP